jgi:D-alanyl-D-alanine carboxypeptidase/D-alanyl-D-alanine-endopeptidase (penicillin-binding protein 4)
MIRKNLNKIILLSFSAIFLTSGVYSENLAIKNLWSRLNTKFSLDLNKQSFCLEVNGNIISQNENEKVRPASVTKLYTSFWALNKLGFDYRFKTQFFIRANKLYIVMVAMIRILC